MRKSLEMICWLRVVDQNGDKKSLPSTLFQVHNKISLIATPLGIP